MMRRILCAAFAILPMCSASVQPAPPAAPASPISANDFVADCHEHGDLDTHKPREMAVHLAIQRFEPAMHFTAQFAKIAAKFTVQFARLAAKLIAEFANVATKLANLVPKARHAAAQAVTLA